MNDDEEATILNQATGVKRAATPSTRDMFYFFASIRWPYAYSGLSIVACLQAVRALKLILHLL
jgi:hypothetical protein